MAELLVCPECGTSKISKNGHHKIAQGSKVQTLKCSACGRRFSENYIRESLPSTNCRIGEIRKDAKNLTTITEIKTVTGDVEGKIINYLLNMKRDGNEEITIKSANSCLQSLITRGANLLDSDSVKDVIANAWVVKKDGTKLRPWSQNRKRNIIATYTQFLHFLRYTWDPPKCNVVRKLPFVPKEKEIDSLVAGCSITVAKFLQLLKETGMRSGEAIAISWIDVDFQKRTITCNEPEKGGNPRVITNISKKLLAMLNSLPKNNKQVFGFTPQNSLKAMFTRERKRLIYKLQNPRLQAIHFHTMRYWRGTLEYHRTHDLLVVKKLLGHKDIRNTELYIVLEAREYAFSEDNFHTAIATNVKEACRLIDTGFEFVTGEYGDGGKIFRKRK